MLPVLSQTIGSWRLLRNNCRLRVLGRNDVNCCWKAAERAPSLDACGSHIRMDSPCRLAPASAISWSDKRAFVDRALPAWVRMPFFEAAATALIPGLLLKRRSCRMRRVKIPRSSRDDIRFGEVKQRGYWEEDEPVSRALSEADRNLSCGASNPTFRPSQSPLESCRHARLTRTWMRVL